MAQRWMQAKDNLGKSHGFARSGAARPLGDVMDDRNAGRVYAEPKPAWKPKPASQRTATMLKADRPKAWRYTGADAFTC